jgi:hypothetical protein
MMINPLGENSPGPKKANASFEVANLDQRLGDVKADAKRDKYIDELYMQLKTLWGSNSNIRSEEIVDYIRKYTAADGVSPYKYSSTHVAVLAQLMGMLKRDGREASPIYDVLNKGMTSVVVYGGIFNSFMMAMIMPPEKPEDW